MNIRVSVCVWCSLLTILFETVRSLSVGPKLRIINKLKIYWLLFMIIEITNIQFPRIFGWIVFQKFNSFFLKNKILLKKKKILNIQY